MTQRLRKKTQVDLDPDPLVEILTSPDFEVACEKARGALDSHVREVERDGDRLVYEVWSTEHARGMTGIDRTRTEQTVTTYRWDLAARRASLVMENKGKNGRHVKVSGSVRVEPDREGFSTLLHELSVDVTIPLLGRAIEKMVIAEIEGNWGQYRGVIDRFRPS